jgi:hypothetical protein
LKLPDLPLQPTNFNPSADTPSRTTLSSKASSHLRASLSPAAGSPHPRRRRPHSPWSLNRPNHRYTTARWTPTARMAWWA